MKNLFVVAAVSVLLGSVPLGQVHSSPEEARPLLPGMEVPDVSFLSMQGEAVALRQLLSEGPTVLVFYRGGW